MRTNRLDFLHQCTASTRPLLRDVGARLYSRRTLCPDASDGYGWTGRTHQYAPDQLPRVKTRKGFINIYIYINIYIRTDHFYHCVKWIPVVSPRRSVFRATPWMRIYLSLFRNVDLNSPLLRWKPAGINPNKPNRSWPKWWLTPRREDPTVKGSFWERYALIFYMCLFHRRSDFCDVLSWDDEWIFALRLDPH